MTTHRTRLSPRPLLVLAAPLAALALAACGSSSKTTSSNGPAASGGAAYGGGAGSTASATTTSAAAVAPQAAALITTKHSGRIGTILAVGPKRMTVYVFASDRGRSSTCTAACAQVWPPVTGTPHSSTSGLARGLGTIRRADGSSQVTFDGHPLYRFIKDKDAGDAYGQALKSFGSEWYAERPTGRTADQT